MMDTIAGAEPVLTTGDEDIEIKSSPQIIAVDNPATSEVLVQRGDSAAPVEVHHEPPQGEGGQEQLGSPVRFLFIAGPFLTVL
jgi:hypothetical protein